MTKMLAKANKSTRRTAIAKSAPLKATASKGKVAEKRPSQSKLKDREATKRKEKADKPTKGGSATFTMGRFEIHGKVIQYRQLNAKGRMYDRNEGEISPVYINKSEVGEKGPKELTITVKW